MSNQKFVVTKTYYGLGGSLSVLLCAMEYAGRTGRTPIIDWRNAVYMQGDPETDLFARCFESPPTHLERLEEVSRGVVVPGYWAPYLTTPSARSGEHDLTRVTSERIAELQDAGEPADAADAVVITRDGTWLQDAEKRGERHALAHGIVPRAHIREKIAAFKASAFGDRPYLGVHFRHGNGEPGVVPHSVRWFSDRIEERLAAVGRDTPIFLCTDCAAAQDYFARRFPQVSIYARVERPLGTGGLHISGDPKERLANLEDSLVELWVLGGARYLVGSKGYFTRFASYLMDPGDPGAIVVAHERRDFKNPGDLIPVAEHGPARALFAAHGMHMDGVYVKPQDDGRMGFHYYWFHLGDLDGQGQPAQALQLLQRKLVNRRLYL